MHADDAAFAADVAPQPLPGRDLLVAVPVVLAAEVEVNEVLFMLCNEAIRLASRQEQNHGRIASQHHAVAPAHDR